MANLVTGMSKTLYCAQINGETHYININEDINEDIKKILQRTKLETKWGNRALYVKAIGINNSNILDFSHAQ